MFVCCDENCILVHNKTYICWHIPRGEWGYWELMERKWKEDAGNLMMRGPLICTGLSSITNRTLGNTQNVLVWNSECMRQPGEEGSDACGEVMLKLTWRYQAMKLRIGPDLCVFKRSFPKTVMKVGFALPDKHNFSAQCSPCSKTLLNRIKHRATRCNKSLFFSRSCLIFSTTIFFYFYQLLTGWSFWRRKIILR